MPFCTKEVPQGDEDQYCVGKDLPLTRQQISGPIHIKAFATDYGNPSGQIVLFRLILDLMKMAESSPKRVENTVGKGESLITINFFFSHSVFKRLELQTPKNKSSFDKGLRLWVVKGF